jgi:hypothetical protein
MSRQPSTRAFPVGAPSVLSRLAASVGAVVFAWLLTSSLEAQTYQVLHSFGVHPDGSHPSAGLIADDVSEG